MFGFQVYTGKDPDAAAKIPLGSAVVKKLAAPLFGKGHVLYNDNFSCVDLALDLLVALT